jgi:hypothetical protein
MPMARAAAIAVLRPVHVGGLRAGAVCGADDTAGDGSVGDGSVGDGSVGDGSVGDGSVGDGSAAGCAVGAGAAYGMVWVTAHPRGAVSSARALSPCAASGCSWVMVATVVPAAVRGLWETCRPAEHPAQKAHRMRTATAGSTHKVPVVT